MNGQSDRRGSNISSERCFSQPPAGPGGGEGRLTTDGRYRCRNPPFNGTTADDEVAPKTANLFERLEPDGSGCLHSKYSPD